MKSLILIDGMALVYRSYYALNRNPRINSKGLNTSATLGFATTLYDLLRQHNPSHIAVAFDLAKPTFRHEIFPQYKANRDAMPEDIASALPYIHRLIEAFGIPILTCEGYEADDVIGTISHHAELAGFDQVLMVTPDKDFAQLVTNCVKVYRLGHAGKPDETLGIDEVCEKFGVQQCRQVIDLLGLWGDSADNIPGLTGIGEKTAKKLIAQFGSIEQMVDHADEIANEKVRKLVMGGGQQALFSKQLATIVLDAPIAFDEARLARHTPNYQQLAELMAELEFRNLAKRLFTDLTITDPDNAMLFSSGSTKKAKAADAQLSLFDVPGGSGPDSGPADLATTALDALPTGQDIAFVVDDDTIAIATSADNYYQCRIDDANAEQLRELFGQRQHAKICYDLKRCKYALRRKGIAIDGDVFDIQLAHYLIESDSRHTLDFIFSERLSVEATALAEQACGLWQLYPSLSSALADNQLYQLYTDVELPLVDVLISMESEGVRIDVEALRAYSAQLTAEMNDIERQIYEQAGHRFNVGSSMQLGIVLYEELKVTDKPPRTATKKYSTAEEVLAKLSDRHPIIPLVLEYRSLSKLVSTYLDSFPKLINSTTGRLHTVFNQAVTATGRLSSSSPNLQNIPVRTDRGREIRKAFVPRDGQHILLAADYSQIELRIIASLSHDEHLCDAFRNGYDIHAATAARIAGIDIAEVSKDQRRRAKSVNFGIVYGISAFGLSEQLGIARKEAAQLIDDYFAKYPQVKAYIDGSIEQARQCGYAKTLLGRRRYLPDINSRNAALRGFAERNAVNMPIQGTSADMIKIAMNRIYRRFEQLQLQSRMILQVHDELVFDVYTPEMEQVRDIVEQEMLQALPLDIPIEVGIEVGQNWLDAH